MHSDCTKCRLFSIINTVTRKQFLIKHFKISEKLVLNAYIRHIMRVSADNQTSEYKLKIKIRIFQNIC